MSRSELRRRILATLVPEIEELERREGRKAVSFTRVSSMRWGHEGKVVVFGNTSLCSVLIIRCRSALLGMLC